jgi:hypothetical protein
MGFAYAGQNANMGKVFKGADRRLPPFAIQPAANRTAQMEDFRLSCLRCNGRVHRPNRDKRSVRSAGCPSKVALARSDAPQWANCLLASRTCPFQTQTPD